MGFEVHSFELQLDCLDVARFLVDGNANSHLANLYNMGIGQRAGIVEASEGCLPGYTLKDATPQDIPFYLHHYCSMYLVAYIPHYLCQYTHRSLLSNGGLSTTN